MSRVEKEERKDWVRRVELQNRKEVMEKLGRRVEGPVAAVDLVAAASGFAREAT